MALLIQNENEKIQQQLESVHRIMNQLSSSWQSMAGETIRERFQSMLPTFEACRANIQNYVKFLNDSVSIYQQTEMKLNTQANGFK